jgi:hypothetical protein
MDKSISQDPSLGSGISPSDLGSKAVETGADCKGSIIMRKLCCTLQWHQNRITYLAEIEEDHCADCAPGPVVVKCYFDRDDRDFEASCCQKLLQFQGIHVPKYLGSGSIKETQLCFALILSWIGKDLDGRMSIVPARSWRQAREVLIKMHALSVIHGDLAPRNMTNDPSTDRVLLYDFSDALTSGVLGCEGFAQACTLELDSFDKLVASAASGPPDQATRGEPGHDHPDLRGRRRNIG